MVLATRTSAPNTSLAVIRPKPRPDSPTASEISVIMLKSELPHEASNPVSKKKARVHHAHRRRISTSKLQAGCYSLCGFADNPMGKCCHGHDPKITRVPTEWSHSLEVHLRG